MFAVYVAGHVFVAHGTCGAIVVEPGEARVDVIFGGCTTCGVTEWRLR